MYTKDECWTAYEEYFGYPPLGFTGPPFYDRPDGCSLYDLRPSNCNWNPKGSCQIGTCTCTIIYPCLCRAPVVCPVSRFQGTTLSFVLYGACWKVELTVNSPLIGDFDYPACLSNNLSNGLPFAFVQAVDSTDQNIQFVNPTTNWSGTFTISRSPPGGTGLEVGTHFYSDFNRIFYVELLAPNCVPQGSCLANAYLGETFYLPGFGSCFEVQVFKDGILGGDNGDPGCIKKDGANQEIVSRFSRVDGSKIYFVSDPSIPNSYTGTFSLKESPAVTAPELQNFSLVNGNQFEFTVDIAVPSCKFK